MTLKRTMLGTRHREAACTALPRPPPPSPSCPAHDPPPLASAPPGAHSGLTSVSQGALSTRPSGRTKRVPLTPGEAQVLAQEVRAGKSR